jgi:predicted dienelactone hydrolase
MTLTDILLIAALTVFVGAWWVRKAPARRIILIASAAAAVVIGVAGYLDDRWQNAAGAFIGLVFLAGLGGVVLKNRITRTDRTGGIPWFSGIFIAIGFAAVVFTILTFPVWPLPKPTGQYAVGVRTFEIVDTSRKGVFAAKPDEPRRLLVRVWYPAGDVAGHAVAPYFTKAEAGTTARAIGGLIGFPPLFTYMRHAQTNSYIDAPLLPNASNLPTVIFSHGYTSYLNQNTSLMEDLASHGYVAFSIQHTYDSSDTVFPNGDVAPIDPKLFEPMANESSRPSQADAIGGDTLDKRLNANLDFQEFAVKNGDRIAVQSTKVWIADRLFLHDTLQNNPPASIASIAQAANLDAVGELGMSFGGAIAGELCTIDSRCAAGVNMDGGNFPYSATNAEVPVPFLMFHSDTGLFYTELDRPIPATGARSFNEFSYERIATAGSRPDVYRIRLNQSRHLGLSDSSWFVSLPVAGPLFGTTPPNIMLGAQNDFIRGFLDKHLRSEANDFPARQFAAYKDWVVNVPNSDLPAWWNAKTDAERAALEIRINAAKPNHPSLTPPPPLSTPASQ